MRAKSQLLLTTVECINMWSATCGGLAHAATSNNVSFYLSDGFLVIHITVTIPWLPFELNTKENIMGL